MSNQTPNTTEQPTAKEIVLEPAVFSFETVKMQMVAVVVILFAVSIANYWPSTRIGFLLDDFLHVDYAARAMHGDAHDLLANLNSNWGGSDLMKSYRPLVSLSIFVDYLLAGVHAAGYHATNILLLFACSLFVSLITLELCGKFSARSGAAPALWAGLLFCVYPLHAESVCWIIGRVDLLCTLFYLVTVFCLLRYQALKEKYLLWFAGAAFLLSLISKEMAVTVPVTATLMLLCIPAAYAPTHGAAQRKWLKHPLVAATGILWAILAAYAIFRTLLLGTAVGGYGAADPSVILNSWRTFADKASLLKIFIPINEELHLPPTYGRVMIAAYIATLALAAVRMLMTRMQKGHLLFLLLWTICALVPTFQIWHIFPNLVGSRLFFLSSAPLCILLSMLALPSTDLSNRSTSRVLAILGAIVLSTIFICWSLVLQADMQPWLSAGSKTISLQRQLEKILDSTTDGKHILLLDLPTDYQGAGMITRPQYLEILLRPPLAAKDYSRLVETIEPRTHGSHEYLWPGKLLETLKRNDLAGVFHYDAESGELRVWQETQGKDELTWKLASGTALADDKFRTGADAGTGDKFRTGANALTGDKFRTGANALTGDKFRTDANALTGDKFRTDANALTGDKFRRGGSRAALTCAEPADAESPPVAYAVEPEDAAKGDAESWHLMSKEGGGLEIFPDRIRIHPGEKPAGKGKTGGLTIWFDAQALDPLQADVAQIDMVPHDGKPAECKLVWEDVHGHSGAADPVSRADGGTFVWLGRFRSWALAGHIKRVGLYFPAGDYYCDLRGLRVGTGKTMQPKLTIAKGGNGELAIQYDASKPERAHAVKLIFSRTNGGFEADNAADLATGFGGTTSERQSIEIVCQGRVGTHEIPAAIRSSAGMHQVQALALDRDGAVIGIPSEPLDIP
jgi:hypothetical protein